jgi:hypothetical protein
MKKIEEQKRKFVRIDGAPQKEDRARKRCDQAGMIVRSSHGAPQKEDRAQKRCDRAGMIVRFSLTPKLDRDMTFRRMRERGRQKPEQKKP